MDSSEKHLALQLADRLASGWPELEDVNNAVRELRRLHAELEEQCRLNGMGSEREAKLMAEIARRNAKEADAKAFVEERKAHWAEQIALGKAKIEADRPCWEQLSELQAENEALRADAERWRTFLSTQPPNTHEAIIAVIDEARSKT